MSLDEDRRRPDYRDAVDRYAELFDILHALEGRLVERLDVADRAGYVRGVAETGARAALLEELLRDLLAVFKRVAPDYKLDTLALEIARALEPSRGGM